jgi:hypothetical protein
VDTIQSILGASIQAAVALSGYPVPDKLPGFYPMEPSELCLMAMPKRKDDSTCPIKALYKDNKIYMVVNTVTDIYNQDLIAKSILVHEMVHYLQDNVGKRAIDCKTWVANEDEAYEIQTKYLIKHGSGYPAGRFYYQQRPSC